MCVGMEGLLQVERALGMSFTYPVRLTRENAKEEQPVMESDERNEDSSNAWERSMSLTTRSSGPGVFSPNSLHIIELHTCKPMDRVRIAQGMEHSTLELTMAGWSLH